MEATGQDLIEFFNYAAKNGLMNANTAGGIRSACKEVLSAVAGDDGWEAVDLTKIDVEDYASRFERLRMSKFKPASLGVYKARFRNGVQMYTEYLANPSAWRYTAERPAAARKKASEGGGNKSFTPNPTPTQNGTKQTTGTVTDVPQGMIQYPFPLRADCHVTLTLPDNMTAREAERLGAFLKTLAFEAPREITTGGQPIEQGV